MKPFYMILLLIVLTIMFSCSSEKKEKDSTYFQFNVSVLLDLSDRIDPNLHPDQIARDKEIIKKVLELVKNNIKHKGTFNSFDKFKIMFYPKPDNPQLFELASNLNFDLEKLEPKGKKLLFKELNQKVSENLDLLYSSAMEKSKFNGSDIWRFFKDEVKDKCIIDKEGYRNYLIILTDGYIYWKYTMNQDGNRYSYITPKSSQIQKFRGSLNWLDTFDKGDYGLIKIDLDISKLSVLVAEVNPVKKHPEDYDVIKKYLSKWFQEMNIAEENYKIIKTDVPTYSKPVVENFFKK